MDIEGFLLCLLVIISFFSGAGLGYYDGFNDGSRPDLKDKCELSLPRSQECIMQYVPEGE